MTDFNALPLAEKIKQAQAGDIVVTDSGARLPFCSRNPCGVWVSLHTSNNNTFVGEYKITDIIRPTARKVPEVVGILRHYATEISCEDSLTQVFLAFADHFEKETQTCQSQQR